MFKTLTLKPRYKHDCDDCVLVGAITYPAPLSTGTAPMRNADLYYCANSDAADGGSVLARFSSRGSDYASVSLKILKHHYIKEDHCSTNGPALIAAWIFTKAKSLVK